MHDSLKGVGNTIMNNNETWNSLVEEDEGTYWTKWKPVVFIKLQKIRDSS